MSVGEFLRSEVSNFRGPMLRLEDLDVPSSNALISRNMEYEHGSVATRLGFNSAWNPNEPMSRLYNWIKGADLISSTGSYLIYYNPSNGNVRWVPNIGSPSPATLYTLAGAGLSIASSGTRLFTSVFNSSGEGVGQCRVIGANAAAAYVDIAFPGPLGLVPVISEPGTAGVVTAGTKRFAYYIISRSGGAGKLGPFTSNVFAPVEFTAEGGKKINFQIGGAWPDHASHVVPAMTASTNRAQFFEIPGTITAVPGGSSFTFNIEVNISDDDLIAQGTDVTDYQGWLTRDGNGNGPISPAVVVEVGNRMGYIARVDGIYHIFVSNPEQHQQITANRHSITLPGFRKMVTAFMQGGNLYILGPNYTYSTQDTGGEPVTWPSPRLIDGSIGTRSPLGVAVTSRGFAWVASEQGLYLFDGGYAAKPISHEVESEWRLINWNAAHTIQIKDQPSHNRVLVIVPFAGATAPSHIFMFDYSEGLTAGKVKYSLWSIASYGPGAIEIVENPTTKHNELWLGKTTAGKVLRQSNLLHDAEPHHDDLSEINWIYETAVFPGRTGRMHQHHGIIVRLQGEFLTNLTSYGLDRTKSHIHQPILPEAFPGKEYMKRLYMISEGMSHRFEGSTVHGWARLSFLSHMYRPWISHRT